MHHQRINISLTVFGFAADGRAAAGGCGGGDCPGGRAAGDPGGGVPSQHQQDLGGPGGRHRTSLLTLTLTSLLTSLVPVVR